MARIRPVGHEDRLTLVEHLDELRTRIIISVAAFLVAFGLCAWQNHVILDLLNEPLPDGTKPITLGVTEPFMTTVTVSAYAALLLALPVILYQLYAFVLPAFSPSRAPGRAAAAPAGARAVRRRRCIRVLRRARRPRCTSSSTSTTPSSTSRCGRATTTASCCYAAVRWGCMFQVPMAILAVTRLGIVTPKQLRAAGGGYAYLVIAVLAALLPPSIPSRC